MENTSRKNLLFWIAIVATVASICVHLYLDKHHMDLKVGATEGQSLCNVSETFNCDTAATSKYAELFGIPMALLGAFTNGLLLVFLLLNRFDMTQNPDRSRRFGFYLSAFISLISVVMAVFSYNLRSVCPFCLSTYVLSFITLGTLVALYKPDIKELGGDLKSLILDEKWVLGMFISVPVLALIVNGMILDNYGYSEIKKIIDGSLSQWATSPVQNFDSQAGLVYQAGSGDSKAVIVEFADFLCPHCRAAAPVLHSFAKSHPDVKLIYKAFPLDGVCNGAVHRNGDGKRCDLAYAVFCAEKLVKKGWETHQYIFENQESLYGLSNDAGLERVCKDVGLECSLIKSCMNGDEVHQQVKNMAHEGEAANIEGTPAIFFNNKLLQYGQVLPVLEAAYQETQK